MFENLSLSGFTWPREPVLYLTLVAAIINAAIQALTGDVTWWVAGETAVGLVMAFIARGRVSPVGKHAA